MTTLTTIEATKPEIASEIAVCECGRQLIAIAPRDVMTLDDLGEIDYVEIEDVYACSHPECGASYGGRAIWLDICDDVRLDEDETARRSFPRPDHSRRPARRAAAATATAA